MPFTALEVHDRRSFLCCPSWLTKFIPEHVGPIDSWNHEVSKEIRDSIVDGSYRYCDKTQCPFLSEIENRSTGKTGPLYSKKDLPYELQARVQNHKETGLTPPPSTVQFSFDRTCNLACPSCRVQLFVADSKKIKEVEMTIDEIQSEWSKNIKTLYITGSGDPFISVGFRKFLREFDKSKFPRLTNIHLHTNATKWDKKMWDSMQNIHPYVKSCEISIDAGTKDTYENKTRINGKWDELIDNLKFINTIDTLKKVKLSFVVQKHNYLEMKTFLDEMSTIFKNKPEFSIFFGKLNDWKTFTPDQLKENSVHLKDHRYHSEFVKAFNEVFPHKNVWTNMQEFSNFKRPKNTLI